MPVEQCVKKKKKKNVALNVFIRKIESTQINDLSIYLKKLEGEE